MGRGEEGVQTLPYADFFSFKIRADFPDHTRPTTNSHPVRSGFHTAAYQLLSDRKCWYYDLWRYYQLLSYPKHLHSERQLLPYCQLLLSKHVFRTALQFRWLPWNGLFKHILYATTPCRQLYLQLPGKFLSSNGRNHNSFFLIQADARCSS